MALTICELNETVNLTTPLRLFEFHSYILRIRADKVLFLGVELERVQTGWLLETPFAVGQTEIEWWDDQRYHRESVWIDPDPNKIDERAQWEQMLADIAHWKGTLVGTTGVRIGSVLFGEGYNVLCVEAIFCLVRQFCDRIETVDLWLQRSEIDGPVNLQTMSPLEMVHHQSDTGVQHWIRMENGQPLYVTMPRERSQEAKRELYQVQDWVRQVQGILEIAIGALSTTVENTWRSSRAKELFSLYTRLEESLRRPPLFQLGSGEVHGEATVVSVHPEFVQTAQLVQQILSPTFSLQSGLFPVSGRHSFGIYELWCFQQIIDCCTIVCESEPITRPEDPLQWGGTIRWITGAEEVLLHYNPRFVAYWDRKMNSSRPYSLVGEQRPDFVVQYREKWLILDAKYRSTRVNVLDAFSSAFSYVTSLKMPTLQRDPEGCLLLVPKRTEGSSIWFNKQFHREHGFGLLCCGPNATDDVEQSIRNFLLN